MLSNPSGKLISDKAEQLIKTVSFSFFMVSGSTTFFSFWHLKNAPLSTFVIVLGNVNVVSAGCLRNV